MSEFPASAVRITIASTPAHLPVVRAALERYCQMLGFGDDAQGGIILAVDEALTNIIRHAYHGRADRPIEVCLRPANSDGPAGLCVELRDWGEHVEPARIRSRELHDVRPGGLGVHIMRSCMDAVDYQAAPGGGTLLVLRKALKESPQP